MFVVSVRRGVAAVAFAGVVAGCSGGSREPTMTTATALAPVAQEVQHAVAKVWPESADIWPGTVLKDRLIILSDGKGTKLIGVDGVTNLTPARLAEKKVTVPASGSSYVTWDGHPAVVINTADPSYADDARAAHVGLSNAVFQAATDEMFHSSQPRLDKGGSLRGTEFPLAVTPRLYRAMLYNDLLQAYRQPDQRRQWLGRAAYWKTSWERAYPDEVRRAAATDVSEGAAGYFEGVATAMAMGSDRGDRDEMRKHVAFRPLEASLDAGQVTLDGEGAALGGVAGLLLDETRKDWKKALIHGGQTPLTLLLNGVAPIPEQPSYGLRRAIQGVLAKRNSDLIPRLNPLVSAYRDRSRPLLMIPLNTATGDLDAGGYYTARQIPYAMLAGLSGTFKLPSGTLRANEASVLAGNVGGRPYLIVPISKKAQNGSGTVRLHTPALTGTVGVTAEGSGGRQTLIAR